MVLEGCIVEVRVLIGCQIVNEESTSRSAIGLRVGPIESIRAAHKFHTVLPELFPAFIARPSSFDHSVVEPVVGPYRIVFPFISCASVEMDLHVGSPRVDNECLSVGIDGEIRIEWSSSAVVLLLTVDEAVRELERNGSSRVLNLAGLHHVRHTASGRGHSEQGIELIIRSVASQTVWLPGWESGKEPVDGKLSSSRPFVECSQIKSIVVVFRCRLEYLDERSRRGVALEDCGVKSTPELHQAAIVGRDALSQIVQGVDNGRRIGGWSSRHDSSPGGVEADEDELTNPAEVLEDHVSNDVLDVLVEHRQRGESVRGELHSEDHIDAISQVGWVEALLDTSWNLAKLSCPRLHAGALSSLRRTTVVALNILAIRSRVARVAEARVVGRIHDSSILTDVTWRGGDVDSRAEHGARSL